MALDRKFGNWSAAWLHHPVVVGRLMPTLIRTRDVTARNIRIRLSRHACADASVEDDVRARRWVRLKPDTTDARRSASRVRLKPNTTGTTAGRVKGPAKAGHHRYHGGPLSEALR